MKKLFFACFIFSTLLASGVERKALSDVDTDAFTTDCQVTPSAGDDHLALVWWIPIEFWEAVFAADPSMSLADKQTMLDALSGVTLLAVVQADISNFGAFSYYSKKEVAQNMTITYLDTSSQREETLVPLTKVNEELEILLGVFQPILGAAMGNLGTNFHFYVLNDKQGNSGRVIDPYEAGELTVELETTDGNRIEGTIELPINALFIPRKCPNGKDAHVTWEYCPWTGEKLEDQAE